MQNFIVFLRYLSHKSHEMCPFTVPVAEAILSSTRCLNHYQPDSTEGKLSPLRSSVIAFFYLEVLTF